MKILKDIIINTLVGLLVLIAVCGASFGFALLIASSPVLESIFFGSILIFVIGFVAFIVGSIIEEWRTS